MHSCGNMDAEKFVLAPPSLLVRHIRTMGGGGNTYNLVTEESIKKFVAPKQTLCCIHTHRNAMVTR